MKESEFKKSIARIDRYEYSCTNIGGWVNDDFVELYNKEFKLTNGAFWVGNYLRESDIYMKEVDYDGNLYECGCLSRWMLRDFLLGMFQYYVINYTDMLEEG